MKRRDFIRTTGLATTFAAVGCAENRSSPAAATRTNKVADIGLQLYTVRSLMEQGVPSTLATVAEAGYVEVEFAGYFGHEGAEIRDLLEANGLRSPSSHVALADLESKTAAQFATAKTIGQKYLVVPWVGPEQRTVDGIRSLCARMNAMGARAQDEGLTLAYHNHDFEFEAVDGTVLYDVMLEELDPELVKMQLDLFWIWFAAKSASQYLSQDPSRYVSCHVKDGYADGTQSIVGDGDVDLADAFAAGRFEHYFVESDTPEDPVKFIRASATNLKAIEY